LARDTGAFFKSILGTLNHILVGDTFWLKRFALHPATFSSLKPVLDLDFPESLDVMLYSDLDALSEARDTMDTVIMDFVAEVSEDDLESFLKYKSTSGEPHSKKLGFLVQHFFNHQTHHRGQVTTLLSQAGVDVGVTDLLLSIREESAAGSADRA